MTDSTQDASDAFIFFGATGDLAYKQIFPALQALFNDKNFDIPVLGVAGRSWTNEQLIDRAKDSIEKNGKLNKDAFAKLSSKLKYLSGDYADSATFDKLKDTLKDAKRPLFYLAIPPNLFATVVDGLTKAGLTKGARVIVEKPFGKDLESAHSLNDTLKKSFDSKDIFRLDHFLGKEVVQNLVYFHMANTLIDSNWSNANISCVQITMAEKFGVSDRGKLYDEEGAVRDVVQNHMLQTIACLTMEKPDDNENDICKMRGNLLRSIRTLAKDDIVRGQFKGYLEVKGVEPASKTETFAALRFVIDNQRWNGVPFYVRVGKCMPLTATEIFVEFKPSSTFDVSAENKASANYVRLRLDPTPQTALGLKTKNYGADMVGTTTEFVQNGEASSPPLPYERLFGDAIRGDSTLFVDEESVEACWRIVDPVLDLNIPLFQYEQGSWGPQEVAGKIEPPGGWHNPA